MNDVAKEADVATEAGAAVIHQLMGGYPTAAPSLFRLPQWHGHGWCWGQTLAPVAGHKLCQQTHVILTIYSITSTVQLGPECRRRSVPPYIPVCGMMQICIAAFCYFRAVTSYALYNLQLYTRRMHVFSEICILHESRSVEYELDRNRDGRLEVIAPMLQNIHRQVPDSLSLLPANMSA